MRKPMVGLRCRSDQIQAKRQDEQIRMGACLRNRKSFWMHDFAIPCNPKWQLGASSFTVIDSAGSSVRRRVSCCGVQSLQFDG